MMRRWPRRCARSRSTPAPPRRTSTGWAWDYKRNGRGGGGLADDNYATLARGVFEGRHFFDNLRKGVNYYLAVKVGLIAIFLLPVLAGLQLPFSPFQIILLELFMDLAASAGLVGGPAGGGPARP